MERVRAGKAALAAGPAAHALAPVLLSRDERQQLRIIKHRVFQRHAQNAMWTRSVFEFDGVTHRLPPGSDDGDHNELLPGDRPHTQYQPQHVAEARLRDQIDAKAREIASTKLQIARFEKQQQANQARFEELISGLKSIADSAALASFHERVEQERVQLLGAPTARELEVVKL
ncbi:hypothetical protein PybrP1_008131 [[Pythium] brassicae (nom. inval.)]|nr:hypothetical protein PybrP1_008131 [[Pythium] brassicae (nom. inval.)]